MKLAAEREAVAAAARRLAVEGLVLGTAGQRERGGRRRARRDHADRRRPWPSSSPSRSRSSTAPGASSRARSSRPPSSTSTSASTSASTPARWSTPTRRWRPRSPACSTSFPASTTRCCCSAGPSASPRTRPSARPELASAVGEALEGRTAALMANHGAVVYAADARGRGRELAAARVGVHASTGAPARSASRGRSTRTSATRSSPPRSSAATGPTKPVGEGG